MVCSIFRLFFGVIPVWGGLTPRNYERLGTCPAGGALRRFCCVALKVKGHVRSYLHFYFNLVFFFLLLDRIVFDLLLV